MKLPTIFKKHKNRTYSYTPRYYDERKERLGELEDKHLKKGSHIAGSYRRGYYRKEWGKSKKLSSDKKGNYRLIIILIILLAIAYIILRRIDFSFLISP